MRLFREVLIESVEQLADLPDTAILTYADPNEQPIALVRADDDEGHRVWHVTGDQEYVYESRLMVWGADFVALLPIEAEEKKVSRQRLCEPEAETFTYWTTGLVQEP